MLKCSVESEGSCGPTGCWH